jgi:hypothetical protein
VIAQPSPHFWNIPTCGLLPIAKHKVKVMTWECQVPTACKVGSAGFAYGAFTLDVKSVLNENLGGILGGT